MIHWTYESCVQLEALWKQGLSADQCAQALGTHTRMQVICKANHMHLGSPEEIDARESASAPPDMRPAVKREWDRRGDRDGTVQVSVPALPARKVEVDDFPSIVSVDPASCFPRPSQGVSIGQLTSKTCKWPIGDPCAEDFHYCGHKPRDGSPYCEAHAKEASNGYSAPQTRPIFKQGRVR